MKKQLLTFLILIFAGVSAFSQEAKLVDEFGILQCEDYLARMDGVSGQLSNDSTGKIYVLVYEGKTKSFEYGRDGKSTIISLLPQYGLADAKIRSMKRRASADNVVFVKAGFREDFGIEIWLVPAGATPPKPNPTLTKIKYRKGKPEGFCTGCC